MTSNHLVPTPLHLVFIVHGIRTLMGWRRQLRSELEQSQGIQVHTFYYGFFSLFRFYFWLARNRMVRKFALDYFEQVATNRPDKISVIAHSFGTYLVYRAVQRYGLVFDTLIFCGSVIPEDAEFTGWFLPQTPRVRRIVNDIGQKDSWVLFGKLVVPGVGAGGLVGLKVPSTNLVERVFAGYKHSGFFKTAHYRKYWLPYLGGSEAETHRSDATLPRHYEFLIAWARPIKVIVNFLLFMGIVWAAAWAVEAQSNWKLRRAAAPFVFSDIVDSAKRPIGCVGDLLLTGGEFTLKAPRASAEARFQILVSFEVRPRSRWSIVDIEVIGDGLLMMTVPNAQYWLYRVRSEGQATFLICGGTSIPSGGGFIDDLVVGFSHATQT